MKVHFIISFRSFSAFWRDCYYILPLNFFSVKSIVVVAASDAGAGVFPEHLTIEERERAESLVLGRGGDFFVHSQVGEEPFDFRRSHLERMPFFVEEDETLDPADVGLFCVDGVVFEPYGVTDLV
jgi:hypothetical protein